MNTQRIFNDDRQMKAVLGMGKSEFQALLPAFTQAWYVELKLSRPERTRKIGGGKKGALKTMEDKLFAILLYLKTYPTFDVFGATHGPGTHPRLSFHSFPAQGARAGIRETPGIARTKDHDRARVL